MNDDNSHNLMFENIAELTWRRNRLTELFIENDIYEYVDVVTTNVNCQPNTNLLVLNPSIFTKNIYYYYY